MKKEYVIGYCTKEADILDDTKNRMYFKHTAGSYTAAIKALKKAVPTVNFYELIKTNI